MSEAFQALNTDYRLQLPYVARVICIDGVPRARRRPGRHRGRARPDREPATDEHRHDRDQRRPGAGAAPARARARAPRRRDRPRRAGRRSGSAGRQPGICCPADPPPGGRASTSSASGRAVPAPGHAPRPTWLTVRLHDPSRRYVAAPARRCTLWPHAALTDPDCRRTRSRSPRARCRSGCGPGAAYPLPPRHDGDPRAGHPASGRAVPWARVDGASGPTGAVLGPAHGDDRGEFLLVLTDTDQNPVQSTRRRRPARARSADRAARAPSDGLAGPPPAEVVTRPGNPPSSRPTSTTPCCGDAPPAGLVPSIAPSLRLTVPVGDETVLAADVPFTSVRRPAMPEYLTPGVYVEETSFRSRSIEGVATSTFGMAGLTRYGPVPYFLTPPGSDAAAGHGAEPDARHQLHRVRAGLRRPRRRRHGGLADRRNYLAYAARAFFAQRRPSALRLAGLPVPAGRPTAGATLARNFAHLPVGNPAVATFRSRWPGAAGNEFAVSVSFQRSKNILVPGSERRSQPVLKGVPPGAAVETFADADGHPEGPAAAARDRPTSAIVGEGRQRRARADRGRRATSPPSRRRRRSRPPDRHGQRALGRAGASTPTRASSSAPRTRAGSATCCRPRTRPTSVARLVRHRAARRLSTSPTACTGRRADRARGLDSAHGGQRGAAPSGRRTSQATSRDPDDPKRAAHRARRPRGAGGHRDRRRRRTRCASTWPISSRRPTT